MDRHKINKLMIAPRRDPIDVTQSPVPSLIYLSRHCISQITVEKKDEDGTGRRTGEGGYGLY